MAKVLVTGMSGAGKSSAIVALETRGHRAVDTDTDEWSEWVTLPDGTRDWIWRAGAVCRLLAAPGAGHLFVSGCKTNQGRFYPRFDRIVLLTAPVEVLVARIRHRRTNPYGQRPEELAAILHHVATVEPLLRATATDVIDAAVPLDRVAAALERIAHEADGACGSAQRDR